MYKKNTNPNIHLYDVDDTLVMWFPLEGVEPITIENGAYREQVYPNMHTINSLRQAKLRGHYVIVHSQGGEDWAELVVKALNLEDFVDEINTKPKWCHDDLPPAAWMTWFKTKGVVWARF